MGCGASVESDVVQSGQNEAVPQLANVNQPEKQQDEDTAMLTWSLPATSNKHLYDAPMATLKRWKTLDQTQEFCLAALFCFAAGFCSQVIKSKKNSTTLFKQGKQQEYIVELELPFCKEIPAFLLPVRLAYVEAAVMSLGAFRYSQWHKTSVGKDMAWHVIQDFCSLLTGFACVYVNTIYLFTSIDVYRQKKNGTHI